MRPLTARRARLTGMPGLLTLTAGQLVSLIGSSMTRFALTIWAWELTGQATALALVAFFSFTPSILLSPLAGALVDRFNRKAILIVSDLATGLWTIVVLILVLTDRLQIWHLYAGGVFAGASEALQFPAYSASITTMVDERHYARASAMQGTVDSASTIVGPILAASLIVFIGIRGVLMLDIATFGVAILTLLFIRIPQPEATSSDSAERRSLLQDSLFGFRYILRHPSLLGLQLIFVGHNLIGMMCTGVLAAMVLARSGNNEFTLGTIQMLIGIGSVVGGVLFSISGGPKRRVKWLLTGLSIRGVLGRLVLGLGGGPIVWGIGAFFMLFFRPMTHGLNQAIWQARVPAHLQGRVFAARRFIAMTSVPLALLIAGPLADGVMEPMMASGSKTATFLSRFVGTGPGSGMAVMFVISGILAVIVSLAAYSVKSIRDAEELLRDAD